MIPYDAVDTFEWLIVRLVNVEPSKCMLQWVVSGVPSGSPSHEYWRSSVPPLATNMSTEMPAFENSLSRAVTMTVPLTVMPAVGSSWITVPGSIASVTPLATLIAAWTFTSPDQNNNTVTSELTSVVFCGIAASGSLLPPPPSSAFWQAPSEDTSDTASTT